MSDHARMTPHALFSGADPDGTTPPIDSDAAAMAEFKREGALLLAAEAAAETLVRRVAETHTAVKVFHLTRDELESIATQFKQTVDVAKEYHIGASEAA